MTLDQLTIVDTINKLGKIKITVKTIILLALLVLIKPGGYPHTPRSWKSTRQTAYVTVVRFFSPSGSDSYLRCENLDASLSSSALLKSQVSAPK